MKTSSKVLASTPSKVGKAAMSAALYLPSFVDGFIHRKQFDGVETHCEFIGYPRSGHSLVGALMNAHPEMVIANEVSALRYFYLGFSRRQVYSLIMRNARKSAMPGKELGGYVYNVPNQWQGRVRNLKVIGDKDGYATCIRFALSPRYRARLEREVGAKPKFVHVIRNPFDIISTRIRRSTELANDIQGGIDNFFWICDSIAEIKRLTPASEIIDIRHEAFVQDPVGNLERICAFFGVNATDDYLRDCSGIVNESPNRSRLNATFQWTSELIDTVHRGIERYPWLNGYDFKSP